MLWDTHAHLTDPAFDPDRDAVLARAFAAGVGRIVEVADAPADWDRVLALCRTRPRQIRCALGLHPYHATLWSESVRAAFLKQAALPEVVAVGEIGLDYARTDTPKDTQARALSGMLGAAAEAGLPVVIHCRQAYEDLFRILEGPPDGKPPAGRPRGVLHCFSGGPEDARRALGLGFMLGIDGPVTYPKNDALRRAVLAVGLDSVVLETDSPYLPPQSRRGSRNESATVPEIAGEVARIFSTTTEEVSLRTGRNAARLFGWPEDGPSPGGRTPVSSGE